jgi:hypothetical protein
MKTQEAWDPNSCAFLSSGGAVPGPREGRFGTAQALEKRLSLRTHLKTKKTREAWDQNHLPGSVVGSGKKMAGENRIILRPIILRSVPPLS